MYPVAHIVVASGAAWSVERVVRRLYRRLDRRDRENDSQPKGRSLFDYRFVALGALLPDIIDKPLAWWILADRVEDDHLIAHTLIFALTLALPGIYFARSGDCRLLSVAFGVALHIACDPVLRTPTTLFWPLFGWSFRDTSGNGVPIDLPTLDAIGATVAAVVLLRLWQNGRLRALVQFGQI